MSGMKTIPIDVFRIINGYYTDLRNKAARKIQYFYAKYKGYQCDDCRSIRLKRDLMWAHSCDDHLGCCYKRVCKDSCTFRCPQGHRKQSQCEKYFSDPIPFDDDPYSLNDYNLHTYLYASHEEPCDVCNEKVVINRNFEFDLFYYKRMAFL